MERLPLHPHPANPPMPGFRLEGGARLAGSVLELAYRVTGKISRLRMPVLEGRRDGLWQHTCFEAFLQTAGEPGYVELNFTASGAWAAYRFSGRRDGMQALELPTPPVIAMNCMDSGFDLTVGAALGAARPSLRMGMCAVLEDTDGRLGYWALAHPGGRADFHDPAGFTLELTPA